MPWLSWVLTEGLILQSSWSRLCAHLSVCGLPGLFSFHPKLARAVTLSLRALGAKKNYLSSLRVSVTEYFACFFFPNRRLVWRRHPGFRPLDSKDYYTLVPSPRAGIREVPRQAMHLFANTLSAITASRILPGSAILSTWPWNPRRAGRGNLVWCIPSCNLHFFQWLKLV